MKKKEHVSAMHAGQKWERDAMEQHQAFLCCQEEDLVGSRSLILLIHLLNSYLANLGQKVTIEDLFLLERYYYSIPFHKWQCHQWIHMYC
jgi:hypothetical protein